MNMLLKSAACCLLVASMAGCGGGGGGVASDPFSRSTPPQGTGQASAGEVLYYNMSLTTTDTTGNASTVAPLSTVVATATLKDSNGNPVSNQSITFVSDPASPVQIAAVSAVTDSKGKAIAFLRAPDTSASADVIMQAKAAVGGKNVSAIAIFKILRSSGNVVKFITSMVPTDPDGNLNTIAVTVQGVQIPPPPAPAPVKTLLQLVPFEVLDLNNGPRTHIPVTVSVYSSIGCPGVYIDSPETVSKTVTTDDNGIGIFNIGIPLAVPAIGDKNACSVIYKAVASDVTDPNATIYSYGGFLASLENKQL
jgi:hypothetical protein